jgi:hypothetical protein
MNVNAWGVLLILLLSVACTKEGEHKVPNNADIETFLNKDEELTLKLTPQNQYEMELELINANNQSRKISLENSPGEQPNIKQHFYTTYCNKDSLVVVLKQGVNTGVSVGSLYWNVLINIKDGSLIRVTNEGEVKDKETGEVISDGQKQAILKLKSGEQSKAMCNQNQQ